MMVSISQLQWWFLLFHFIYSLSLSESNDNLVNSSWNSLGILQVIGYADDRNALQVAILISFQRWKAIGETVENLRHSQIQQFVNFGKLKEACPCGHQTSYLMLPCCETTKQFDCFLRSVGNTCYFSSCSASSIDLNVVFSTAWI